MTLKGIIVRKEMEVISLKLWNKGGNEKKQGMRTKKIKKRRRPKKEEEKKTKEYFNEN